MKTIDRYQKSAADMAAKLAAKRERLEEAQATLDEAAGAGRATSDLAAEVVRLEAEVKALAGALEAARRDVEAGEDLQRSKEFKAAAKRIADLRKVIDDQDTPQLVCLLVDLDAKARAILDQHQQIKNLANQYAGGMTEGEHARLQSSQNANLARFVGGALAGMFNDLRVARPDLADRLPPPPSLL